MISAVSSSVHLKMEETNDDLDVEDVSLVKQPRSFAQGIAISFIFIS